MDEGLHFLAENEGICQIETPSTKLQYPEKFQALKVAQICNLLYRRILFC
jgi:hypothetical protein